MLGAALVIIFAAACITWLCSGTTLDQIHYWFIEFGVICLVMTAVVYLCQELLQ